MLAEIMQIFSHTVHVDTCWGRGQLLVAWWEVSSVLKNRDHHFTRGGSTNHAKEVIVSLRANERKIDRKD